MASMEICFPKKVCIAVFSALRFVSLFSAPLGLHYDCTFDCNCAFAPDSRDYYIFYLNINITTVHEVYNMQEFTSENLDTVEEYQIHGGGGTDFDCIFKYLKEEGSVPNRLIVFTDGYPFGSWGDADYCDTTWIIHGDPDPNPPFGTWAIYDDHKKK